jgi:hypothetical protein
MGKVGGARPGAGRKPGKVSAAKRALAEMAKDYAETALATLVEVCTSKEAADSARVAAANALLDRGYGRPPQAIQHTGTIQTEDVTKRDAELFASRMASLAAVGVSEEGTEPVKH